MRVVVSTASLSRPLLSHHPWRNEVQTKKRRQGWCATNRMRLAHAQNIAVLSSGVVVVCALFVPLFFLLPSESVSECSHVDVKVGKHLQSSELGAVCKLSSKPRALTPFSLRSPVPPPSSLPSFPLSTTNANELADCRISRSSVRRVWETTHTFEW